MIASVLSVVPPVVLVVALCADAVPVPTLVQYFVFSGEDSAAHVERAVVKLTKKALARAQS